MKTESIIIVILIVVVGVLSIFTLGQWREIRQINELLAGHQSLLRSQNEINQENIKVMKIHDEIIQKLVRR
jgi:hypothetical protein